jgi:2-methylisocitrate lyase-like PEP mutase family enzyme
MDETIWRLQAFADLGADVLFPEAPRDEAEMARLCDAAPGVLMANMLEGGITPILPPERLQQLGYRIAAYPLTLLASAVHAMESALADLASGRTPERLVEFGALREILGFGAYDALLARYDETAN